MNRLGKHKFSVFFYRKYFYLLLFLFISTDAVFSTPTFTEKKVKAVMIFNHITDLFWTEKEFTILSELQANGTEALFVYISAVYQRKNWKLFYNKGEVIRSDDGIFSLKIPIDSLTFKIQLRAEGPKGNREIETRHFAVDPENHPFDRVELCSVSPEEQIYFKSQLGISYLNYAQTSIPKISETTLAVGIEGGYPITYRKLYLEGGIDFSFLAVTKSSPLYNLRIFNTDIKLRSPILRNESSVLSLALGYEYLTSFGNDSMGYRNLSGPLIEPSLHYTFSNESQLNIHLNYAPVLNGPRFFQVNNFTASLKANYQLAPDQIFFGTQWGFYGKFSMGHLEFPSSKADSKIYSIGLSVKL